MKKWVKKIALIGAIFCLTLGIFIYAEGTEEFDTVSNAWLLGNHVRTEVLETDGTHKYAPTNLKEFPFSGEAEIHSEQGSGTKKERYSTTKVAFDLLYGYNKTLVDYKGEIPVAIAFEDGNVKEGKEKAEFKDLRYTDPDSIKNLSGGIVWSRNWEKPISDIKSYKELQQEANRENDIRLMSHLKTYKRDLLDFDWGSKISGGVVTLALYLISAVFSIERIGVAAILTKLDGGALGEVINKIFIGERGAVFSASPFLIICILGFIFAMVKAAWAYAKGNGAVDKPREMIILGLVGLGIIGMAMTNKAYLFASPVSNIANELLESVTTTTIKGTDIFLTKVSTGSNIPQIKSYENSYNHESLIKKAYIDMTIEAQFGVAVEDLNINGNYLANKSSCNVANNRNVANNLGYYYWYATSNANTLLGNYNSKMYSGLSGKNQLEKFEEILNCLQENLDGAGSDSLKRTTILTMAKGLAGGSSTSITGSRIIFSIECVLLAWLLIQFVIPIVMARLELIISTFGLAVAGPLFITGNDKAVKLAKGILTMFIVAFLKITIYELIVTVIVYLIVYVMKPGTINMFLTITLTVMGIKFAPKVAHMLKFKINGLESKFSPELGRARQQLRQTASRGFKELGNSRLAGSVDDDGNVRINLIGKLANQASMSFDKDGWKGKLKDKKQQQLRQITQEYKQARGVTDIKDDYKNLTSAWKELSDNKNKRIKEIFAKEMAVDGVSDNYSVQDALRDNFEKLDMNKINNLKGKDNVEVKYKYSEFTKNLENLKDMKNKYQSDREKYNNMQLAYMQLSNEEKASAEGKAMKAALDDRKIKLDAQQDSIEKAEANVEKIKLGLAKTLYTNAYNKANDEFADKEERLEADEKQIEEDFLLGRYKGYTKDFKESGVTNETDKLAEAKKEFKKKNPNRFILENTASPKQGSKESKESKEGVNTAQNTDGKSTNTGVGTGKAREEDLNQYETFETVDESTLRDVNSYEKADNIIQTGENSGTVGNSSNGSEEGSTKGFGKNVVDSNSTKKVDGKGQNNDVKDSDKTTTGTDGTKEDKKKEEARKAAEEKAKKEAEEKARLEAERKAKEEAEKAKKEQERLAKEKAEAEKKAAEENIKKEAGAKREVEETKSEEEIATNKGANVVPEIEKPVDTATSTDNSNDKDNYFGYSSVNEYHKNELERDRKLLDAIESGDFSEYSNYVEIDSDDFGNGDN